MAETATEPLLPTVPDPDEIDWPEDQDPREPRIHALCRREDIKTMPFGRFVSLLIAEDAVHWDTYAIADAKYSEIRKPGFWDRGAMSALLSKMLATYPCLRRLQS